MTALIEGGFLMPCEGAGARKHAREWNYITNAENALQSLAGRFYGGMENENTAL